MDVSNPRVTITPKTLNGSGDWVEVDGVLVAFTTPTGLAFLRDYDDDEPIKALANAAYIARHEIAQADAPDERPDCPACGGDGINAAGWASCPACNGSGYADEQPAWYEQGDVLQRLNSAVIVYHDSGFDKSLYQDAADEITRLRAKLAAADILTRINKRAHVLGNIRGTELDKSLYQDAADTITALRAKLAAADIAEDDDRRARHKAQATFDEYVAITDAELADLQARITRRELRITTTRWVQGWGWKGEVYIGDERVFLSDYWYTDKDEAIKVAQKAAQALITNR